MTATIVTGQMRCVEDATVVEVYTVSKPPSPSDIEREDTNGMLDPSDMKEYLAQREDR